MVTVLTTSFCNCFLKLEQGNQYGDAWKPKFDLVIINTSHLLITLVITQFDRVPCFYLAGNLPAAQLINNACSQIRTVQVSIRGTSAVIITPHSVNVLRGRKTYPLWGFMGVRCGRVTRRWLIMCVVIKARADKHLEQQQPFPDYRGSSTQKVMMKTDSCFWASEADWRLLTCYKQHIYVIIN